MMHADARKDQIRQEAEGALIIGLEPVEYALDYPGAPDAMYIRKVYGYKLPQEPMWKVTRWDVWNLTKDITWEHQPNPGARDKTFYSRCRFETFGDAIQAALEARRRGI